MQLFSIKLSPNPVLIVSLWSYLQSGFNKIRHSLDPVQPKSSPMLISFVFDEVISFYFGWKSPFSRKTFLQKRLWKSRCNKRKVCSMLFAASIAVEQEVIVADIVLSLFIFTCFWYTPTHTFNRSRAATRDVVETETARPRPGENSKIETSSKYPRLETWERYRDLKVCGLCQNFSKNYPKNVITSSGFRIAGARGKTKKRVPLMTSSYSANHDNNFWFA